MANEITSDQIKKWKEEYGSVFRITLGGTTYYFTYLTKNLYTGLLLRQQTETNFNYEFEAIKTCVIHPEITDDFKTEMTKKSGLGITLLESIMEKSGWEQVEAEEL